MDFITITYLLLMTILLVSAIRKAFWEFECLKETDPKYKDYRSVLSLYLSFEPFNTDRVLLVLPWINWTRIIALDRQSPKLLKAKSALIIYRCTIILLITYIVALCVYFQID